MRSHAAITGVVGLICAMTSIAQQKPDFSGEWQLNRELSTLSTGASIAQRGTLRIQHREPNFKCEMTIVMDGKTHATSYELLSDGHERAGTDAWGRMVSSLGWDGDALVATWRIEAPNGDMTISFRYELRDGGGRLRAVEQIRGGGRDQDNTWVFDR
jgi:hypothetical protein